MTDQFDLDWISDWARSRWEEHLRVIIRWGGDLADHGCDICDIAAEYGWTADVSDVKPWDFSKGIRIVRSADLEGAK